MASGDVMNTAARLQSAAPINGILVGGDTYRATRDAIDYAEAEPIAAKGKSEPVEVWQVVGVREREAAPTQLSRWSAAMTELEQLDEAWQAVLEDAGRRSSASSARRASGRAVCSQSSASASASGAGVHWGRCLPYGEGITYWPVTEIVKSAAGSCRATTAPRSSRSSTAFIDGLPTDDPDELRTIAAALSNVIGIPMTPRGTYTAGEIAQGELHWGLRRTAQLLAAREPTVFVFEDLHWAEPTLIELLEYLAVSHDGTPLLAIWTARPEFLDTEARVRGRRWARGGRSSRSCPPTQARSF